MVQTIVQGSSGYIGLGLQASITTSVPATKFQRVTSCGITYKEPGRAVVNHIQNSRYFTDVVRGVIEVNGSMSGNLTPDEIFGGIGWAALLGASNTVSGSASVGFTHVFDEDGALPNKGFTLEVYEGGSAVMFDLIGMFLNKLALAIPQDGAITFTSDWFGVTEVVGGTVSTATFNNDGPFEGWMASLYVGATIGAATTEIPLIQSLNWSYDNKLEALRGIGSRFLVGRAVGRPEVMIDFGMLLQNTATYYNYFKNNTNNALKIVLTHDALAGTASGVYSITIRMPKVVWFGDAPELSGTEKLEHSNKVQALYDSTAGYQCRVTIVNSVSGAYTVTA